MVSKLKALNFRVTLWIHPFVSCHSLQFWRYWRRGLLVNMNVLSSIVDLIVERSRFLQLIYDDILFNTTFQPLMNVVRTVYEHLPVRLPGISLWWNGLAGSLDFSNEATRDEYAARLKHLQTSYDIDSFKFDAGEVNWLPPFGSLANPSSQEISTGKADAVVTSFGLYPHLYAHVAHRSDATHRLQEVRVGYRTQTLPMFVRIIDKDSDWTYSNGLRSLLPTVFNFGLVGYPFILPDMVGDALRTIVEATHEILSLSCVRRWAAMDTV